MVISRIVELSVYTRYRRNDNRRMLNDLQFDEAIDSSQIVISIFPIELLEFCFQCAVN